MMILVIVFILVVVILALRFQSLAAQIGNVAAAQIGNVAAAQTGNVAVFLLISSSPTITYHKT